MYLKHSLHRFVKVKSLARSVKFGSLYRYCHSGFLKSFSISKYEENRRIKGSYHVSIMPRNFYSEYSNKYGSDGEKSIIKSQRGCEIQTKDAEFNSNNFSNNFKNQKPFNRKYRANTSKSLNLKSCRPQSKNLSTLKLTALNAKIEKSNGKPGEPNDESDSVMIMANKAEICRSICLPPILPSLSTKPDELKTSLVKTKNLKQIIEKLTDAEIKEICRNKCPCQKCDAPPLQSNNSENQQQYFMKDRKNNPVHWNFEGRSAERSEHRLIKLHNARRKRAEERCSQFAKMTSSTCLARPPILREGQPNNFFPMMREGQRPMMGDGQRPTMLDGQRPTMLDGQRPTMLDGQRPMMRDGQRPMMRDGQVPMMRDGQVPMMRDGQPPMMRDGQRPIPHNMHGNIQHDVRYHLSMTNHLQHLFRQYQPNLIRGNGFQQIPSFMQPQCNSENQMLKRSMEPPNGLSWYQLKSQYEKMIRWQNERSMHQPSRFCPAGGANLERRGFALGQVSHPIQRIFAATNRSVQSRSLPFRALQPLCNFKNQNFKRSMQPPNMLSRYQLKSKHERMIRLQNRRTMHLPLRFRPTGGPNIDRMAIASGRTPHPIQRLIPARSPLEKPLALRLESNYQRIVPHQPSVSHFDQLKPPQPQNLQINQGNIYSNSNVRGRFPAVGYGHEGIPHKSANQTFTSKRQRKLLSPIKRENRSKEIRNMSSDLQVTIPEKNSNQVNGTNDMNNNKSTPSVDIEKMASLTVPPNQNLDQNESRLLATKPDVSSFNTTEEVEKIDWQFAENPSVVVSGPKKLDLVTSLHPQLRNNKDVLIQMEYVNLTETDAQHYATGKYTPYSYASTVAGRTGTGIIIKLGRDVQNFKLGDKVLVKQVSCGKCSLCLNDRRDLCKYISISGTSLTYGTLRHFHVHSTEFITKIPQNVSLINAAKVGTLSSAIRACQKAMVTAGDFVMVIDGGSLGTATALAAQSMGATTVCLADTREPFLEKAKKLGIKHVFLIDPRSPSENTAIKIWEHIGEYPRLVFDCRGSELTKQIAITATKTGGKVIIMRDYNSNSILNIANAVVRDIDIITSTIGNDESERAALQFMNTGKFVAESVKHHYDLSNVREAFEELLEPNRLESEIVVKCRTKDDGEKKKNKLKI